MGDSADDSGTGTETGADTSTGTQAGTVGGSDESGPGDSSSETSSSGTGGTGTDTDDTPGTDDGGLVCTSVYDPVCGVDGETYDHPCSAIEAGVEIKRDGPCFGDCEGSCSVGGSSLTLAFAVIAVVCLRPRRRSRRRR